MNIQNIEDAQKLPKGRLLVHGVIEAELMSHELEECVNLVVQNKVNRTFYTQAGIVEYAGNNLGWGAGGGYVTTGGYSEVGEADTLQSQRDNFLALPEGSLIANCGFNIEVDVISGEVIDAIQHIEKCDGEEFKDYQTQAEIIAHAGALGWGQGDVYTAC